VADDDTLVEADDTFVEADDTLAEADDTLIEADDKLMVVMLLVFVAVVGDGFRLLKENFD
jgi:hypothetical protein